MLRLRVVAALCLVLAATSASAQDTARQLKSLAQRKAAVQRTWIRRYDANREHRQRLSQTLKALQVRSPRPREDILRTQIAIAESDDREEKLELAHRRALKQLERRRLAIVDSDSGSDLPAETPGELPHLVPDRQRPATAVGQKTANLGALNVFRRDVLQEDVSALQGLVPVRQGPPAATPSPLDRSFADPQVRGEIGDYPRARAKRAYGALLGEDRESFDALLATHADSPAAQAAMAKALASGNVLGDMNTLSRDLEGKTEDWIRTNTTLTGNGTNGVKQQYNTSCVPTVAQALRGEFDPVYAWRMRQAGPVHQVDDADPLKFNRVLAAEQRELLERGYTGDLKVFRGRKGEAQPRNGHGRGRSSNDDTANAMSEYTGLTYQTVMNIKTQEEFARAPDVAYAPLRPDQSVPMIDAPLRQGIPVPMTIVGADAMGHAVLAYAVRDVPLKDGGTDAEYRIFNPWNGDSVWVPASEIRQNAIKAFGRQGEVLSVLEPGFARHRTQNPDLAAANANIDAHLEDEKALRRHLPPNSSPLPNRSPGNGGNPVGTCDAGLVFAVADAGGWTYRIGSPTGPTYDRARHGQIRAPAATND
jgi:hypothetical protein